MSTSQLHKDALSESEICVLYREAADKHQQIGILADLCLTSRERIVGILQDNGYIAGDNLPKPRPRQGPAAIAAAAEIPVALPAQPGRKRNTADIDKLRELAAQGVTCRQAADALGLKYKTVWGKAKQYGIEFAAGTVGPRTPAEKPTREGNTVDIKRPKAPPPEPAAAPAQSEQDERYSLSDLLDACIAPAVPAAPPSKNHEALLSEVLSGLRDIRTDLRNEVEYLMTSVAEPDTDLATMALALLRMRRATQELLTLEWRIKAGEFE